MDPRIASWFSEAHRLFNEAAARVNDGEYLSALSSLTAVPPLHSMLIDRCSELLTETDCDAGSADSTACGLYL